MADIIKIKDRLSLTERCAPREGGEAKVLLFTGIRYERTEQVCRAVENRIPALPRPGAGIDQLSF